MISVSWDDQRVFLAVLEEGSLSGAARRLKLTQPTVRARLESLECALSTVLFIRSAKGLTATEQARDLAESARAMERASEAFVRAARGRPGEVAGVVRISAPELLSVAVLPPMLRRLRACRAELSFELDARCAIPDLLRHEADVAIRVLQVPMQDGLMVQRAGAISLGLFAHVDYLQRRGTPQTIAELSQHELIGPDRAGADLALMASLLPGLQPRRLAFRSDSHAVQLSAIRAGLGIGMLHAPIGLADTTLRAVLPDLASSKLDTWLVTAEDLTTVPRIRAVLDHLVRELRAYAACASPHCELQQDLHSC